VLERPRICKCNREKVMLLPATGIRCVPVFVARDKQASEEQECPAMTRKLALLVCDSPSPPDQKDREKREEGLRSGRHKQSGRAKPQQAIDTRQAKGKEKDAINLLVWTKDPSRLNASGTDWGVVILVGLSCQNRGKMQLNWSLESQADCPVPSYSLGCGLSRGMDG